MDVARDDLRRPRALRARDRIGGKQRRLRVRLVEILDDRERLHQDLAVIERERRHALLRIDRAEFLAPLPAAVARQVHGGLLVGEVLQIERDADAIGGRRAEIAIEFH